MPKTQNPGKHVVARPPRSGTPGPWLWIGWLALAVPTVTPATEVQVQLDDDTPRVGESFIVSFISAGQDQENPDFSPLQRDFEILQTTRNQTLRIFSGVRRQETRWNLSLVPKRAGRLRLPAVTFGTDSSPEYFIEVQAAQPVGEHSDDGTIFLKVEVQPLDPYLQAESHYILRLYTQKSLHDLKIDPPHTESNTPQSALHIQHLESRRYNKRLQGQDYKVLEQRYALFPLRSGRLRLAPIKVRGRIGKAHRSFLEPFTAFQQPEAAKAPQRLRLESRPIELQVRPIPPAFRGKNWLPARKLQLTEEWKSLDFRVGEPVTRVVRVIAQGVRVGQLPRLEIAENDSLRSYADQPRQEEKITAQGLLAQREQNYALLPSRPGPLRLPEIRLEWWNTEEDRAELAILPATPVEVRPARTTGTLSPQEQASQETSQGAIPENARTPAAAAMTPPQLARWRFPAWFFAALWLITLLAWAFLETRRRRTQKARGQRDPLSFTRCKKQLDRACHENDARSAMRALLQWGASAFPENPPRHLGALARLVPELEIPLQELGTTLYARQNTQRWQGGENLWRVWNKVRKERSQTRRQESASPPRHLPPLYPEIS